MARPRVKCGPAGTIVLLECRANKGEPHADQLRGLRRWHFSSRKRFADATHWGATLAGKRETRWLYAIVCFALRYHSLTLLTWHPYFHSWIPSQSLPVVASYIKVIKVVKLFPPLILKKHNFLGYFSKSEIHVKLELNPQNVQSHVPEWISLMLPRFYSY